VLPLNKRAFSLTLFNKFTNLEHIEKMMDQVSLNMMLEVEPNPLEKLAMELLRDTFQAEPALYKHFNNAEKPKMNKPQFTAKGNCHGVNLVHRSQNDPHALVQIFTEDDETWYRQMTFDSAWLDELIKVLQTAQTVLKSRGIKDGNGYKLRSGAVVDSVEQMYEES
jgi:hypothetical protein